MNGVRRIVSRNARTEKAPAFAGPRFIQALDLVHDTGRAVLAVDRRDPGRVAPFDAACGRIAEHLRAQSQRTALMQYVKLLAGSADVRGVDLAAASTPLVQ